MREWSVRVVERAKMLTGKWSTVDVFNVRVVAKNKAAARKFVRKHRLPPRFVLGKVWPVKASAATA
jgi:hypothetical protein